MVWKAFLVSVAAVFAGCGRSNNLFLGEVEAQVGAHRVRVTDCYRFSAPPPQRLPDVNGQPAFRYMPCRDADVRIVAGELAVNGKPYGRIGPNDAVLVDHGVVSVHPADLRDMGGK